jgi:hypothetical protein
MIPELLLDHKPELEICRLLCRHTISGSLARLAGSGTRRARPSQTDGVFLMQRVCFLSYLFFLLTYIYLITHGSSSTPRHATINPLR